MIKKIITLHAYSGYFLWFMHMEKGRVIGCFHLWFEPYIKPSMKSCQPELPPPTCTPWWMDGCWEDCCYLLNIHWVHSVQLGEHFSKTLKPKGLKNGLTYQFNPNPIQSNPIPDTHSDHQSNPWTSQLTLGD